MTKPKTLEEIATNVVNQIAVGAWQYCSRQWVIELFTKALRNERERCAKIAEVIPDSKFDLDHEPARTERQIRHDIAATIRALESVSIQEAKQS